MEHKAISSNSITQSQEIHSGNSPTKSTHQGTPTVVTEQQAKVSNLASLWEEFINGFIYK